MAESARAKAPALDAATKLRSVRPRPNHHFPNAQGTTASAIPGVSFFAYGDAGFGARVGCGDLDGDGICEIISGEGPDPDAGSCIRGWNFDGGTLVQMPDIDFDAYDAGVTHGANAAAARP